MKNHYPYEKFSNAVTSMATSPDSIQNRVALAYADSLIHVKVEELPEEIQAEFKELKQELTSATPVGDESSVFATMRNMGTIEAIELANKICNMAHVIQCDYLDV